MITSTNPTMQSATHLVFDPFTPDTLARLGATNVVQVLDRLVVGPSRRDPAEHARARHSWWPPTEEWDPLGSPDLRLDPPVVIWASASIVERLSLWRACAWLRGVGLSHDDVLILDFERLPPDPSRTPKEPLPPFDATSSVSDHPDETLVRRFATAKPWPISHHDRAVSLWDQFVDSDPSRFVQSCLQGVPGFPELASLWTFLSGLFPRTTAEGTLLLSRLDHLLLSVLSDSERSPPALLAHDSQAGVELRHWISCTGDLFLEERLSRWAHHPSGAVAQAPHSTARTEAPSFVVRLTDAGRRLRDTGLSQLSDAPSLPVGGIEAYSPSSPWVLSEGGIRSDHTRGDTCGSLSETGSLVRW